MELSDTAIINVRGKQLDRLFKQSRLEVLLGVVALVLGVAASDGVEPAEVVMGWAGATALAYGARFLITELYRKHAPPAQSLGRWTYFFVATVAATGICWGGYAAYVLSTQDLASAAPLLLLASAATMASVGMHAGSVPAGAASAIGALAPATVVMVADLTKTSMMGALALVMIGATGVLGARLLKRYVWEAAMLQGENEQLHSHLDQRRNQIEKLNVALKTTQGKREQAEVGLRRTAADLGLIQGKAKALAETLERISPLCQVTALANRRHFDQVMDLEWRRAAREARPLSIIVVDMDEYDEYLATHGRQSADSLLKRVGQTIKGFGRRAGDVAARYDDSKLTLLLPGCDVRNASRIAEALRKRIEGHGIPHSNAKSREVMTVHIGVAMIKPTRSMRPEELLKRVDAALYEARFQGGNKVVVFQPLSKLRVERWDTPNDGPLNEQSLLQKLLVWGYDTNKQLMRPGAAVEPQILSEEMVLAILTGELKVEVEGHAMAIKPGDCVLIPQGVELALEVVGDKPVMKLTAAKNK